MDLSKGTAYGICISQMAITLGILLYFPVVKVDVFSVQLNPTNTSIVDQKVTRLVMPGAFLALSGMAAIFATTTLGMSEQGVGSYAYNTDTLEETGIWDFIFWVYVFMSHMTVFVLVTSPVDIFAVLLASCFSVHYLSRICSPRTQTVNITRENMNLLGYAIGVIMACYSVPSANSIRLSGICVSSILDYFMGLGHTYDRETTMETVINCRLFYISVYSLLLPILYSLWDAID